MIWLSSLEYIPSSLSLVVCGFGVIIDIFSPSNRFIKDDFPTFGLPIIAANPDLNLLI
jgi:hypothetical protein